MAVRELHIMVDIETLGVRPDAKVIEIGWALFDPWAKPGQVVGGASVGLDVAAQGGSVDPGTVDFWLRQSDAARKHLADIKKLPPREALDAFEAAGSPWGAIKGVWSHGPAFDLTILQSLYNRLGRYVPWNYRAVRDTRTLAEAVRVVGLRAVEYPQGGTTHSGADDAANQAKWVQGMYAALQADEDPLA